MKKLMSLFITAIFTFTSLNLAIPNNTYADSPEEVAEVSDEAMAAWEILHLLSQNTPDGLDTATNQQLATLGYAIIYAQETDHDILATALSFKTAQKDIKEFSLDSDLEFLFASGLKIPFSRLAGAAQKARRTPTTPTSSQGTSRISGVADRKVTQKPHHKRSKRPIITQQGHRHHTKRRAWRGRFRGTGLSLTFLALIFGSEIINENSAPENLEALISNPNQTIAYDMLRENPDLQIEVRTAALNALNSLAGQ